MREKYGTLGMTNLTFAVAFLYLVQALCIKSLTRKSPSPHGTTTRTDPKHTVTFIISIDDVNNVAKKIQMSIFAISKQSR